jgi:hypothetical protein
VDLKRFVKERKSSGYRSIGGGEWTLLDNKQGRVRLFLEWKYLMAPPLLNEEDALLGDI